MGGATISPVPGILPLVDEEGHCRFGTEVLPGCARSCPERQPTATIDRPPAGDSGPTTSNSSHQFQAGPCHASPQPVRDLVESLVLLRRGGQPTCLMPAAFSVPSCLVEAP